MQPYFFPYIGYWQLIHAVDRFVIYDDVNYIKGGWINRNRILINGQAAFITAPLDQASSFKRICDTSLQHAPHWRNKLVRMVENTYRKAPFFAEVFPTVEKIIRHDRDNLADYLAYQLQTLSTLMGIDTEFVVSSRSYGNSDLSGQERVIDICRREGATTYINAQGGESLYDHASFKRNGVELKFLIPSALEYRQFGAMFVPWLSIIDVLMFNCSVGTRKLLDNFTVTENRGDR